MLTRAILHLALSLWLLRQLEQVRLHCFLWLPLAYQLPFLHLCWSAFPSMLSPSVLCKLPEVFTISAFPLWSTQRAKYPKPDAKENTVWLLDQSNTVYNKCYCTTAFGAVPVKYGHFSFLREDNWDAFQSFFFFFFGLNFKHFQIVA